ncbi:hypothetical protein QJS04_geneDACA011935 [Acorus gramineus]|uniref:Receptor ligand binding region domain-containing protein n=1 Tax=Acorus gramineus TaxID=55184 RepID=A0AAV9AIZ1_ACOGR|nr:hypothetical protein QJS04_geneDACA011935 [Acorus gramineus]
MWALFNISACSPRRDLPRSVPDSGAGVPTCRASPLAFPRCESPEPISDSVSVCGDCSAGLRSLSYRNGRVSASELRVRNPYFIYTTMNDSAQVKAIADFVQNFQWREVILVDEDTEYGTGILPDLIDAL